MYWKLSRQRIPQCQCIRSLNINFENLILRGMPLISFTPHIMLPACPFCLQVLDQKPHEGSFHELSSAEGNQQLFDSSTNIITESQKQLYNPCVTPSPRQYTGCHLTGQYILWQSPKYKIRNIEFHCFCSCWPCYGLQHRGFCNEWFQRYSMLPTW